MTVSVLEAFNCSRRSWGKEKSGSSAGGVCNRLFQTEALSLLPWRMLRLLAGDSSISARIACTSSVADMTGKRTTSAQPSASQHCKEADLSFRQMRVDPRNAVYAASASSSQIRLSSSSIENR